MKNNGQAASRKEQQRNAQDWKILVLERFRYVFLIIRYVSLTIHAWCEIQQIPIPHRANIQGAYSELELAGLQKHKYGKR